MSANKNYFLFILIVIFAFSAVFLFAPKIKIYAAELNVDYPTSPTGININPQSSVPEYLKYIFDFGMFVGFIAVIISLAIAGIYYFLSPAIPSALSKAKDRVYGAFSGLLILLLVYLIITTINPNLSFFYLNPLEPVETPPAAETPPLPGVYLYQTNNCSAPPNPLIQAYNLGDLKELRSKVKSAKIVHDYQSRNYFIGILYESFGFWGKCLYINPNSACNGNIDPPFASSAAIYRYNHNPSGGGITFYREPFFDSEGGSFKVSGAETKQIYVKALKDLNFMSNPHGNINNPDDCSVPEEKMECVQWDDRGGCTKRKCPDLTAKNIGSIKIEGDYVVLLIYFGPEDKPAGPWSLCQSFPSPFDTIKSGPNKIAWEDIQNQNRLPNFVAIFPVMDNSNPN